MPTPNRPLFDQSHIDAEINAGKNPLGIFQQTLKAGQKTLLERFQQDEDIGTIVHDNARLIDQILIHAWQLIFSNANDQAALIAVGGYGRSELHPGSDIDLMLLFDEAYIDREQDKIAAFLTMLWDIGLEVGQSVRTIPDCVREAQQDVTVMTNLIESRFLCGEKKLYTEMEDATAADKIWPSNQFFEAKLKEQKQRYLRFDDTAYKLEPNIKESPGGLRDIQTIGWVAKRHFGAKKLAELVDHGFLELYELETLLEGQKWLWKIRFALHTLTGRREDRLLFDYQKTLALDFGFDDDGHNLAVEQFMQKYYRTVMKLDRLNEILLQHFEEAILYADDSANPVSINSRFQATKGFIEVTNEDVFRYYPCAFLEMFYLLQSHPDLKGVRASTIRLIRSNLHFLNEEARNDLRCRSIFMEILRQPRGITHALRRMNRYGILAAYLPAFENIVGRMQYDLFHNYTVDEHILFVVRNLRRFTVPEYFNEYPLSSEIMQRIAKPELLYIAGLYHDIAKGRGGDHSELGEQEAIAFCRTHGLMDYDTQLVGWLVKYHLIMSTTAQRLDISDPEVIQDFTHIVGDQTHLDYIYLLTVADIRATNPTLWNSWKDSLLRDLYRATSKALRVSSKLLTSHEHIMQSKKKDVRSALAKTELTEEAFENIWREFPIEYFIQYTSDEIAWHIESIHAHDNNEWPVINIRFDKSRGSTAILVFGPLQVYQFASTTACLEKIGLDVVDATIITTDHGCTLNTYFVLEQNSNTIHGEERLSEIKTALQYALNETREPNLSVQRRMPRQHKHFDIDTKMRFSEDEHNPRTILELTTADRPGLLSRIGEAFRECEISLQKAKIATIGMRIEDVFYIVDKDHNSLDEEKSELLRQSILDNLSQ